MPLPLAPPAWTQDLPVCFPDRPCRDFSPYGADLINLTTALTPASGAILVGCLLTLVVAVVLMAFWLRPRALEAGPTPWLVLVAGALAVLGAVLAKVAEVRAETIALIYGFDGAPPVDLIGSWPVIGLVGDATAVVGLLSLMLTGGIATLRLRLRPAR